MLSFHGEQQRHRPMAAHAHAHPVPLRCACCIVAHAKLAIGSLPCFSCWLKHAGLEECRPPHLCRSAITPGHSFGPSPAGLYYFITCSRMQQAAPAVRSGQSLDVHLRKILQGILMLTRKRPPLAHRLWRAVAPTHCARSCWLALTPCPTCCPRWRSGLGAQRAGRPLLAVQQLRCAWMLQAASR